MVDLKYIRENAEHVQKSSQDKKADVNIAHILELDEKFRNQLQKVEELRAERNKNSSENLSWISNCEFI